LSVTKKAGAKLFLALANHHDGFDAWNSKYHAWNAQNIGPRRDVIGEWAAAAREQELRFGVTVHAARNWWWFQVAHLCDRTGPLAGVPYDGCLTLDDGMGQWWQGYDPQQLYCRKHGIRENPDEAYVRNHYNRVLAMSHHKLGDDATARSELEKARGLVQGGLNRGFDSWNWREWVFARLLLQEADAMIPPA